MKWFTSSTEAPAPAMPADHPPVPAGGAAKCPVDHAAMAAAPAPAAAADGAAKCPVDHASMAKPKAAPSDGAKCPIDHSGMPGAAAANVFGTAVGAPGSLNPLNSMPVGLSATQKAPGQKLDLPTEKTLSGIPRPPTEGESSSGSVWEYPSPQQFYNALVRKGWETPEESIEMVVDIHNWINEGAWDEVMKWEKRLPG
jgi:cytochrome c heme-lyase